MKKAWLYSVIILLLTLRICAWQVRAPELFGDGRLYLVGVPGGYSLGVVDAWGWWLLYGHQQDNNLDCSLVQLTHTVGDATGAIPCRIRFETERNKFTGWIDFRGHTRPFCGADRQERIPGKCKLSD